MFILTDNTTTPPTVTRVTYDVTDAGHEAHGTDGRHWVTCDACDDAYGEAPICTGQDDDGCREDPDLGACEACGFVRHDIPTSAENAHDDLCCGSVTCTVPEEVAADANPFLADLCVTHDRPRRLFAPDEDDYRDGTAMYGNHAVI